jgi:hypothetical protein
MQTAKASSLRCGPQAELNISIAKAETAEHKPPKIVKTNPHLFIEQTNLSDVNFLLPFYHFLMLYVNKMIFISDRAMQIFFQYPPSRSAW